MRIGRWTCLLFLFVALIDKPLLRAGNGKNYAHTWHEGKKLVAQKNYAKAVKMLTQATEESTFSIEGHIGGIWATLGDAYRGLGNFDRALDAYSKETQNQYEATKGKGIVYADTGRYELALSYLQDALNYKDPYACNESTGAFDGEIYTALLKVFRETAQNAAARGMEQRTRIEEQLYGPCTVYSVTGQFGKCYKLRIATYRFKRIAARGSILPGRIQSTGD